MEKDLERVVKDILAQGKAVRKAERPMRRYKFALKIIFLLLFLVGIKIYFDLTKSYPYIDISFLILMVIISFLFYKIAGTIDEGSKYYKFLQNIFILGFIVGFFCLVGYSKNIAYIEEGLFGGKIKSREVEVYDSYKGDGIVDDYYLEIVDSKSHTAISIIYFIIIIGSPAAIFYFWQKTPKTQSTTSGFFDIH